MKIGLLTVPFNNNYGGFLQAYALTTILRRLGHDVIVFNRRRNQGKKEKIKHFLKFIWKDKKICLIERISINTRKFVTENINLTPPIYSTSDLNKEYRRQKVDRLIVGSDQVWRYKYAQNSINDYFFGFIERDDKTPRISYAASFGVDYIEYPKEYLRTCTKHLKMFKAISVREDSAVNILKEYFDVSNDVAVVADPTLLLQPEDYWLLYHKYTAMFHDKYIFKYILDEDDEYEHIIDNIIKFINFPVFTIKSQTGDISKLGVIEPVEKWLAGIASASYVITDSYHGTVFSILFNRPFVVLANRTRGYTRLEYLLRHFGIADRVIDCCDNVMISNVLFSKVNWNEVNEKLNRDRIKSIEFIKKCLS